MKLKYALSNLQLRFVCNASVYGSSYKDIEEFLQDTHNKYDHKIYAYTEEPYQRNAHKYDIPDDQKIHDITIYVQWTRFWYLIRAFKTIVNIRKAVHDSFSLMGGDGYIGIMFVMDEAAQVDEMLGW